MKLVSELLFFLPAVFVTLMIAPAGQAETIDLGKQESAVEFTAIGKPSMLKIKGAGGKIAGDVQHENSQITGNFVVALGDMTTGIELRDEHMKKKYLEIDKYPTAVLKISKLVFDKDYFLVKGDQKNVPFTGKLTLHGVENDVQGTAQVVADEKLISVDAKMTTAISQYKINIPSYLGIKVADEVEIKVALRIKK